MAALVPRALPGLAPAPAVATPRLSSQSRRDPTRSQEWRPRRSGFWTICQERRRRSCRDIQLTDAGLLRRLPKDMQTICQDRTQRSAKDIRSIGADILRLSKNVAMNRAASPQRSPKATSRLFSNPPNTQARPPNFPPTQPLLHGPAHCRICFTRVNHNGGALPSFGHLVCAIRP